MIQRARDAAGDFRLNNCLRYPRVLSVLAKTCCCMRLDSKFLVDGREQLISRQLGNIDNARCRGTNVGGSYIHLRADGVNARRSQFQGAAILMRAVLLSAACTVSLRFNSVALLRSEER